jgi:hypothetical protein
MVCADNRHTHPNASVRQKRWRLQNQSRHSYQFHQTNKRLAGPDLGKERRQFRLQFIGLLRELLRR